MPLMQEKDRAVKNIVFLAKLRVWLWSLTKPSKQLDSVHYSEQKYTFLLSVQPVFPLIINC